MLSDRQTVDDPANAGIRREPELPEHEEIAPEASSRRRNSTSPKTSPTMMPYAPARCAAKVRGLARQAAMDPGDGIDL